MTELLKDGYSYEKVRALALDLQSKYPPFQVDNFLKSIFDERWDDLGLNARTRQITTNMRKYLPPNYRDAIGIIDKIVANYSGWSDIFAFIFPDFIEAHEQNITDWDFSIAALARYTIYSSSESAVRPFIIADEERMMAQMYAWSKDENEHIRRLASEGCRPQLPWTQSLPKFKQDPAPILPILEQLKTDPSLYVRKSVANNLNDISKTHPDLVTKLAQDWYGENDYTNWIVKHGCRTLLKQGNRDVLAIFGFHDTAIDVSHFAIDKTPISIGDSITFSFTVSATAPTKIRLEYGVDYVKANGKRNRKVFQISENALKADEKKSYTKKHAFADLSTRKHYPGTHSITLIVNGAEQETLDFELK